MVLITKSPQSKLNYKVEAKFSIHLHYKDLSLLNLIQTYFVGIGTIIGLENKDSAEFRVSSLKQITEIILPHFVRR